MAASDAIIYSETENGIRNAQEACLGDSTMSAIHLSKSRIAGERGDDAIVIPAKWLVIQSKGSFCRPFPADKHVDCVMAFDTANVRFL